MENYLPELTFTKKSNPSNYHPTPEKDKRKNMPRYKNTYNYQEKLNLMSSLEKSDDLMEITEPIDRSNCMYRPELAMKEIKKKQDFQKIPYKYKEDFFVSPYFSFQNQYSNSDDHKVSLLDNSNKYDEITYDNDIIPLEEKRKEILDLLKKINEDESKPAAELSTSMINIETEPYFQDKFENILLNNYEGNNKTLLSPTKILNKNKNKARLDNKNKKKRIHPFYDPVHGRILSEHVSIPQINQKHLPKCFPDNKSNVGLFNQSKFKIDNREKFIANKDRGNISINDGGNEINITCPTSSRQSNLDNELSDEYCDLSSDQSLNAQDISQDVGGEGVDDEILDLLEQQVDEASAPLVYDKSVLKAVDKDEFEVLPDKWIEITHNSGIPIYLHKISRVCTVSRPYFLGMASVRKHSIPIGSIPCLHYKRFKGQYNLPLQTTGTTTNANHDIQLEANEVSLLHHLNPENTPPMNAAFISDASSDVAVAGIKDINPIAQALTSTLKESLQLKVTVESAFEAKEKNWITPAHLRQYCSRLFDFHSITVRRFKNWSDRRRHIKRVKIQRPFLSSSAKIVKCILPAQRFNGQIVTKKKNFFFNPEDKTVLSILHEYVQNVLKTQVSYTFHTVDNSIAPFGSRLFIKGVEYGVGYGSSKKNAKTEAARVALSVLNPDIANLYNDTINTSNGNTNVQQTKLSPSIPTGTASEAKSIEISQFLRNKARLINVFPGKPEESTLTQPRVTQTRTSNTEGGDHPKSEGRFEPPAVINLPEDLATFVKPTEEHLTGFISHALTMSQSNLNSFETTSNTDLIIKSTFCGQEEDPTEIKSSSMELEQSNNDSKHITVDVQQPILIRSGLSPVPLIPSSIHYDQTCRRLEKSLPSSSARGLSFDQPSTATIGIADKRSVKLEPPTTIHNTIKDLAQYTFDNVLPTEQLSSSTVKTGPTLNREEDEYELFNQLTVTDPLIAELSIKAGQPTPYTILLQCLKRNFGLTADSNIKSELKSIGQNKHLFTLTVGNHIATVYCQNKKEGKHKASQQIIQKIHSQIMNWGSILRLYGRPFTQELKEKKLEERSITALQNLSNNASCNDPSNQFNLPLPNVQVLSKLKAEMFKLHDRKKVIRPIGTVYEPNYPC